MATYQIRGIYFVIYVTKQHFTENDTSYGTISGADSGVLEEQISWDIRSSNLNSYQNFGKLWCSRLRAKRPRTTRCNVPEVLKLQYNRFFETNPSEIKILTIRH